MAKMSKAEQDDIVETLLADIENIDTDTIDEVCENLDAEHEEEVAAAIRDFADNAIGSTNWDSDEHGFDQESE